jgi:hypothetical protein
MEEVMVSKLAIRYSPDSDHSKLSAEPWLEMARIAYILITLEFQMPKTSKKLLQNHSLELTRQVAAERLRRAGVTLGPDLGLPRPKSGKTGALIKRLAGG